MSEASKTPETDAFTEGEVNKGSAMAYVRAVDLARSIELRLTEALDRAQRVEQDIQAYRGALGYTVPAKYDGRLSDGTVPRCGICEAQSSKIAELEKDAARLDWWGGDIRNAIDKAMAEGKPARNDIASSGHGEKEDTGVTADEADDIARGRHRGGL